MDLESFERLKRFQNPTMDNDGKKCSFQVAKLDQKRRRTLTCKL